MDVEGEVFSCNLFDIVYIRESKQKCTSTKTNQTVGLFKIVGMWSAEDDCRHFSDKFLFMFIFW